MERTPLSSLGSHPLGREQETGVVVNLRDYERASIRAFVQQAADDGYLSGRVLDYGCGKQPYRDIVEAAGGEYHGFDLARFQANVSGEDMGASELTMSPFWWPIAPPILGHRAYDAILCTQVLQYVEDPADLLGDLRWQENHARLEHPFALVLTYPTNWPEVEPEDLHRFTKAGMERLLTEAGFEIVRHERRAEVLMSSKRNGPRPPEPLDYIALGYGVIARA